MTRTRILTLLGYNSFFWLCFWLFAYWTFPYERLAAYLSDKVNEGGSGYTLEIGALSPYWFTGVELEDVLVRKQASVALATPPDPKAPAVDQAIRVQRAHARLGLLGLLTGSRDLDFTAYLGTGEIAGTYSESGEQKRVSAKLTSVDLSKLGLLESLLSLPMKGALSGDFDLALGQKATDTSGTIKLNVQKLTVGDGKAKLKLGTMGGLTIDPISAGDVSLELDVKQGVGNLRKLNANGTDLKLDGSGDVRFARPLTRSRIGLTLRLELTEAYRNKSSRTKAMFALLETSGMPQVAAAKAPDGSYKVRISGLLSSARVMAAGEGQVPSVRTPEPVLPAGDDEE